MSQTPHESSMPRELSVETIRSMKYPDFVGLINQWNVLPGAYTTLSKWAIYSKLNSSSRLLEVACTTGFSSRELSLLTGCSGTGFDLSNHSVEMAEYNRKLYAPNTRMQYVQADGYHFSDPTSFSHIVVGAALKFFSDPAAMLERCISFFGDEGYILASPFYVTSPIPQELIVQAEQVFHFTPTQTDYKATMDMYKTLEVLYEDRQKVVQETEGEIEYYCKSTINRACKQLGVTDEAIRGAMHDRLYEVKRMSNLLRPYQEYSVLVLRYRKSVYPNRFIELF